MVRKFSILCFIICLVAGCGIREDGGSDDESLNRSVLIELIVGNMQKQLVNDDKTARDVLCRSERGDTLRLSRIIGGRAKAILYGGDSYCNSCIDHHLSQINSLSENTGDEIIILFKNVTPRELALIKSNNRLTAPVFSASEKLGLPVEEEFSPCFFILKPNLTTVNTFYPIKEMPHYNSIYYDYLENNI